MSSFNALHILGLLVQEQAHDKIKSNQKTAVSEYLDKTFGRWYDDIRHDT
jgi:hypothetical protein